MGSIKFGNAFQKPRALDEAAFNNEGNRQIDVVNLCEPISLYACNPRRVFRISMLAEGYQPFIPFANLVDPWPGRIDAVSAPTKEHS